MSDPVRTLRRSLVETIFDLRTGKLNPLDHLNGCIERARDVDKHIHAFVALSKDLDTPPPGYLAGIPIAVKDLFDTFDMPTLCGAADGIAERPLEDAALVRQFRAFGATVIGKSVTTEFAWRTARATRNPWNLAHTPGGSSSGSAAAVAAGVVPLALGTQTFGSVIRPAAFCGVVGFKPSLGILPTDGIQPLSPTLDQPGLFTRTCADMAHVFGLLCAEPNRIGNGDADTRAPRRIGIFKPPAWKDMEPAAQAVVIDVADGISRMGCSVVDVQIPDVAEALETAWTILSSEAAQIFGPSVARHGAAIGAPLRDLVRTGQDISPATYKNALIAREKLQAVWSNIISEYDAILTPPALGEAPGELSNTGDAVFCTPWTLVGFPALCMPQRLGPGGLPLGFQLVSTRGTDDKLLAVGRWIERTIGDDMPEWPGLAPQPT